MSIKPKPVPATVSARDMKVLKISQAHVLPGMSLVRWQAIVAQHGAPTGNLDGVPATVLDLILADIRAITQSRVVPLTTTEKNQ